MYLELQDTNAEFRMKILQGLCTEMNKAMRGIVKRIEPDFKRVIDTCFTVTETYSSLLSGKLRGAFGFPNGTETRFVQAIMKAIKDDMHIVPLRCFTNGTQIAGGIQVNFVASTLENILNSPLASHTVQSQHNYAFLTGPTAQSFKIPWMEWLLVEGDKIQVMDYSYIFKFAGRSAHGIMVPTKKPGNFFSVARVGPQFAGVVNNNWITRTLDDFSNYIEARWSDILERELTR
jgi:hypothetical protein